jgi:hypothetical protein
MIVFDNHLLAATPEVEISVIPWNPTFIKDGKILCVSQHIRQRPLMQEQCNSYIRIPGELYIMIGIFCYRSSWVMKPSIWYIIAKMVTLTKLLCHSPTKCSMRRNGKVDSGISTCASHKSLSFISFLVCAWPFCMDCLNLKMNALWCSETLETGRPPTSQPGRQNLLNTLWSPKTIQ